MKLPLHIPPIGDEESAAIAEVLRSGFLVQGPRVAAFERALAQHLGFQDVVACSSGTAALHLALKVLECGPGDEVIVPAFGFPATANVVELCGARAVPADVDPENFALTAASIQRVMTHQTVGVMVVHPFGIPAPMEEIETFARQRGWWVCEDAACALGSELQGRWGRGDNPLCFSFHPRKVITTGEGGAVATNDVLFAERLRQYRNHGIASAEQLGWKRFVQAGFNYRLTDLAAAMGIVQLGRLEEIVAVRRQVVSWYREIMAEISTVRWPKAYDLAGLSCQSLVVLVDEAFDRDQLIDFLTIQDIQSTIGGYFFVEQPYFAQRYQLDIDEYPIAKMMGAQSLTLPLTHRMTRADVQVVGDALKTYGNR